VGYANSSGDVVFDPSLPFSDVSANVNAVAPFYARTFGMFGRLASIGGALPYAWGSVEGNVGETFHRATRSGLADAALRFACNIVGTPALSPREVAARKPGTCGFGSATDFDNVGVVIGKASCGNSLGADDRLEADGAIDAQDGPGDRSQK
jgi:hypothetical protein